MSLVRSGLFDFLPLAPPGSDAGAVGAALLILTWEHFLPLSVEESDTFPDDMMVLFGLGDAHFMLPNSAQCFLHR